MPANHDKPEATITLVTTTICKIVDNQILDKHVDSAHVTDASSVTNNTTYNQHPSSSSSSSSSCNQNLKTILARSSVTHISKNLKFQCNTIVNNAIEQLKSSDINLVVKNRLLKMIIIQYFITTYFQIHEQTMGISIASVWTDSINLFEKLCVRIKCKNDYYNSTLSNKLKEIYEKIKHLASSLSILDNVDQIVNHIKKKKLIDAEYEELLSFLNPNEFFISIPEEYPITDKFYDINIHKITNSFNSDQPSGVQRKADDVVSQFSQHVSV